MQCQPAAVVIQWSDQFSFLSEMIRHRCGQLWSHRAAWHTVTSSVSRLCFSLFFVFVFSLRGMPLFLLINRLEHRLYTVRFFCVVDFHSVLSLNEERTMKINMCLHYKILKESLCIEGKCGPKSLQLTKRLLPWEGNSVAQLRLNRTCQVRHHKCLRHINASRKYSTL